MSFLKNITANEFRHALERDGFKSMIQDAGLGEGDLKRLGLIP